MVIIGLLALSMTNSTKLLLQGIRYPNIIIGLICCIVAIIKIETSINADAMISMGIVVLLMIITNLSNDILDIETDSINKPNRPLIASPSAISLFRNAILICVVSVFILSFFMNLLAQCIAIASIPFLMFYSKLFKALPLIGNIFVAFYLAMVFIFIEIAITNSVELMLIPSIFAFGISLIREIIKDIEDFNGDYASGIKTLPILIGINMSIAIANIIIIIFLFFCMIMMISYVYFYYALTLFLLVFMPLFYLIFFLIKNPTSKSCADVSALLKKITILGLIIIYIT